MKHIDDEREEHGNYIWFHGRRVERDHPDVVEERKRRAARRCQVDYPDDKEQYEYEDDSQT